MPSEADPWGGYASPPSPASESSSDSSSEGGFYLEPEDDDATASDEGIDLAPLNDNTLGQGPRFHGDQHPFWGPGGGHGDNYSLSGGYGSHSFQGPVYRAGNQPPLRALSDIGDHFMGRSGYGDEDLGSTGSDGDSIDRSLQAADANGFPSFETAGDNTVHPTAAAGIAGAYPNDLFGVGAFIPGSSTGATSQNDNCLPAAAAGNSGAHPQGTIATGSYNSSGVAGNNGNRHPLGVAQRLKMTPMDDSGDGPRRPPPILPTPPSPPTPPPVFAAAANARDSGSARNRTPPTATMMTAAPNPQGNTDNSLSVTPPDQSPLPHHHDTNSHDTHLFPPGLTLPRLDHSRCPRGAHETISFGRNVYTVEEVQFTMYAAIDCENAWAFVAAALNLLFRRESHATAEELRALIQYCNLNGPALAAGVSLLDLAGRRVSTTSEDRSYEEWAQRRVGMFGREPHDGLIARAPAMAMEYEWAWGEGRARADMRE